MVRTRIYELRAHKEDKLGLPASPTNQIGDLLRACHRKYMYAGLMVVIVVAIKLSYLQIIALELLTCYIILRIGVPVCESRVRMTLCWSERSLFMYFRTKVVNLEQSMFKC